MSRPSHKFARVFGATAAAFLIAGSLFAFGCSSDKEAEPAEEPAATEAPEPAVDLEALQKAVDDGYQVFTGELRVLQADELCELQELDSNMGSFGGEYAVVLLYEPSPIIAESADGSGQRTEDCTMIGVAEHTDYEAFVVDEGDIDSWREFDGQTVSIGVRAEETWFPSDVSLPVGEPRTSTAILIQ